VCIVEKPDITKLGHWETPFFMVYRAEAILPPEVTMGSLRVQAYDEAVQDEL
jgi:hypothetical protein